MIQTTTTTHYDWSLFNNRDISNKCMIILKNKFNALQELCKTLTLNDEYENFVKGHIKAAAECIPTKLKVKYRVLEETLAAWKKRDNVKIASLQ